MSYELQGKIKQIMDPKTFGSGFTVREFVVTVEDGKYPQDIVLQFVKDKVSVLDNFNVGQTVNVQFNLNGREHNGRYYNSLQAWKMEADSTGGDADFGPVDDSKTKADFDKEDSDVPF